MKSIVSLTPDSKVVVAFLKLGSYRNNFPQFIVNEKPKMSH